jgi:hypothetical protein
MLLNGDRVWRGVGWGCGLALGCELAGASVWRGQGEEVVSGLIRLKCDRGTVCARRDAHGHQS